MGRAMQLAAAGGELRAMRCGAEAGLAGRRAGAGRGARAFVGLGALLVVYIGNLALQNVLHMHYGIPGYQRIIAQKLIAISSEERHNRRTGEGGRARLEVDLVNLSQKGDWDNWRNETLDGKRWDFDEKAPMANCLPQACALEYPFSTL